MGQSSIWIDDSSNLDILDIRNRTRKLANQLKNKDQELGLVVIAVVVYWKRNEINSKIENYIIKHSEIVPDEEPFEESD